MPPGEVEEGFFGVALGGVGVKEPPHDRRKIGELDCRNQFAGETLIPVGAASDDNLIAFFATDFDA
jgi:hypothetical protein